MKLLAVGVVSLLITGCATSNVQGDADMSAFLDSQHEVAVIDATVRNPLPRCYSAFKKAETHHADLSVPRSIRGYLKNKEGDLCKKSH